MKNKNKLYVNGSLIEKGDFWEIEGEENGIVVNIDYKDKNVYIHDGKEGWMINEEVIKEFDLGIKLEWK